MPILINYLETVKKRFEELQLIAKPIGSKFLYEEKAFNQYQRSPEVERKD